MRSTVKKVRVSSETTFFYSMFSLWLIFFLLYDVIFISTLAATAECENGDQSKDTTPDDNSQEVASIEEKPIAGKEEGQQDRLLEKSLVRHFMIASTLKLRVFLNSDSKCLKTF